MVDIPHGKNMNAVIKSIEYYLPEKILTNEQLAGIFPEWPAQKIEKKLGIIERHIADEDECASDLGFAAARKLFAGGACLPEEIDYVLLCTQSPDYFLPTTACLLQEKLGIPQTAGALDINLGCSGYIYGLGLAKGLIASGQATNVLFITADTYSKYIEPDDKSTRTLFGDGAAATLIGASEAGGGIDHFVYGTSGAGGKNLIVEQGGMKSKCSGSKPSLYMNGTEILSFTLKVVPKTIDDVLEKAGVRKEDVDYFVLHQANKFILDVLRTSASVPKEKYIINMEHTGNTVSSSIPIALRTAMDEGILLPGSLTMLVGFGVGLSWGGCMVQL